MTLCDENYPVPCSEACDTFRELYDQRQEVATLVEELHDRFFDEGGPELYAVSQDNASVPGFQTNAFDRAASIVERLRCLTDPVYVHCAYDGLNDEEG